MAGRVVALTIEDRKIGAYCAEVLGDYAVVMWGDKWGMNISLAPLACVSLKLPYWLKINTERIAGFRAWWASHSERAIADLVRGVDSFRLAD